MINKIYLIVLLLAIIGCKEKISTKNDLKIEKSKAYRITSLDTVYICNYPKIELYVLKEDYNKIVIKRDEFFNNEFSNPDSYYTNYLKSENDKNFEGEFGADAYYQWYTYFLKKKYNPSIYKKEREDLLAIHNEINNLNALLKGGGSYFSHNIPRIHAYVEWNIYKKNILKNDIAEEPENEFLKKKSRFISSLKKNLNDTFQKEIWLAETSYYRTLKKREAIILINFLESKINTAFKLHTASEFQKKFTY